MIDAIWLWTAALWISHHVTEAVAEESFLFTSDVTDRANCNLQPQSNQDHLVSA